MEIRGTKRAGYEARLIFSGLDLEVMAAVVRERMHNLAINDQANEVSDLDVEISRWGRSRRRRSVLVADLKEVSDWLSEFAVDTDTVVAEIPDITYYPAYANDHIPKRIELGKHAVALANQLNEAVLQRYSDGDFDHAIANLMDQRPLDTE